MRVILFAVLFILISSVIAQETHNLEIIWVKKASPEVRYLGSQLSSGDFNGDSFADIVINGDSLHGDTWTHKAYIFFGGPQFDTIPDVIIVKGFIRLKGIGDINDDGFDDLALGSPNSPFGRVYIYLGGNPMDTICDFEMRGPQDASAFGCAVSSGDVNGDSFTDLIVGAYGYDNLKGRVYIYLGGPSFDTIPDVILEGGHNNDPEAFGRTVSGSGDVNNDGYDDIIIGAMNFDHDRGRIYIYYGGDPMNTIYDVAMIGDEPNVSIGEFGVDFIKNLLTFDHAITSSPLWGPTNPQGYNPGKVYVLFGGSPMDSIPDIWMIGQTDGSWLGMKASSAGDLNGDSCDEIITGAPTENDHKGTAYIWLGGSLLDTIPDAWLRGEVGGDRIGFDVATAGDVNNDGKDEIMVSNYAGRMPRVWVCKYTGPGIGEESLTQNAERLTLEIYPNPAKSVIRVSIPPTFFLPHQWGEDRRRGIKIFDVSGKLIKEVKNVASAQEHKKEIKVSLKGINPGIYFLRLGKETKKFLVVK